MNNHHISCYCWVIPTLNPTVGSLNQREEVFRTFAVDTWFERHGILGKPFGNKLLFCMEPSRFLEFKLKFC